MGEDIPAFRAVWGPFIMHCFSTRSSLNMTSEQSYPGAGRVLFLSVLIAAMHFGLREEREEMAKHARLLHQQISCKLSFGRPS